MEERDDEKLQEVLERKVTQALEERGRKGKDDAGIWLWRKGEERERMMQVYEAAYREK